MKAKHAKELTLTSSLIWKLIAVLNQDYRWQSNTHRANISHGVRESLRHFSLVELSC